MLSVKKAAVNTEGNSQRWGRGCDLKYLPAPLCCSLHLEWSLEREDYKKWKHFGDWDLNVNIRGIHTFSNISILHLIFVYKMLTYSLFCNSDD